MFDKCALVAGLLLLAVKSAITAAAEHQRPCAIRIVKTEVQGRQRPHGYADYMGALDGETIEHGHNVVPGPSSSTSTEQSAQISTQWCVGRQPGDL